MEPVKKYKRQSLFGGWTRVELLLELYDEAIENIKICQQSSIESQTYANAFLKAQKTILAIHSGLKPDEYEIAFNVARLLHFVLVCLEQKKYDDSLKVLLELQVGFKAIEEEAKKLEAEGKIPPLVNEDSVHTVG